MRRENYLWEGWCPGLNPAVKSRRRPAENGGYLSIDEYCHFEARISISPIRQFYFSSVCRLSRSVSMSVLASAVFYLQCYTNLFKT